MRIHLLLHQQAGFLCLPLGGLDPPRGPSAPAPCTARSCTERPPPQAPLSGDVQDPTDFITLETFKLFFCIFHGEEALYLFPHLIAFFKNRFPKGKIIGKSPIMFMVS